MVRLAGHRLIAGALALLVTAGLAVAILRGTGEGSAAPSGAATAALGDPFCAPGLLQGLETPSNPAYRGPYTNPPYGYAVTIPAGLAGRTRAGSAPRGFTVLLAGGKAADLRVDAVYDALYDITAAGVHTRDIMDVRLFDRLLSNQADPFELAGVQGGRYRMQLVCPGSPQVHVFDDVIVVRNREIYRVELQTTPQRLAQDEPLLDELLDSWRWLP